MSYWHEINGFEEIIICIHYMPLNYIILTPSMFRLVLPSHLICKKIVTSFMLSRRCAQINLPYFIRQPDQQTSALTLYVEFLDQINQFVSTPRNEQITVNSNQYVNIQSIVKLCISFKQTGLVSIFPLWLVRCHCFASCMVHIQKFNLKETKGEMLQLFLIDEHCANNDNKKCWKKERKKERKKKETKKQRNERRKTYLFATFMWDISAFHITLIDNISTSRNRTKFVSREKDESCLFFKFFYHCMVWSLKCVSFRRFAIALKQNKQTNKQTNKQGPENITNITMIVVFVWKSLFWRFDWI